MREGDLVAEINGRPLLVLDGAVPAYRDMRPGSVGPDVEQLNRSLERLGLLNSDARANEYSVDTAAAIVALYDRAGYSAPPADVAVLDEITAETETVAELESELNDAKIQLWEAALPPSDESLQAARSALAAAERELAAFDSILAIDRQAQQRSAAQVASDRDAARSHVADLENRLQVARNGSSTEPEQVQQLEQLLREAHLNLRETEESVIAADEDRARSEIEAQLRRQVLDDAVAQARTALDRLNERDSTDSLEAVIDGLLESIESHSLQLAALRDLAGPVVPVEEIVFVPTLPRVLEAASHGVGDASASFSFSFSSDRLIATGDLGDREHALLADRIGSAVRITPTGQDDVVWGVLASIDTVGTDGRHGFIVELDSASEEPTGNVRVEFVVDQTAQPSLAVPVVAVYEASGTSWVDVWSPEGSTPVSIDVTVVGDGFAAVESDSARLTEGALVVIGSVDGG